MLIQTQPIMRYRHFTVKDPQYGAGQGDTLLFNKFFNVLTQGGPLQEDLDFPETRIRTVQDSCVATEYGNSIPFSEKLLRLSKFDSNDVLQRSIVNDMAKTMDTAVYTQFAATKIYYTPIAANSNKYSATGAAGAAAGRSVSTLDLVLLGEGLQSGTYISIDGSATITASPVEPYDEDGNYILIASVGFGSAIRMDTNFIDAANFGDPDRQYAGEIGLWQGWRVVLDNHKLPLVFGTTAFKGPAFGFGANPVKEICALPEEIRMGIPLGGGRKRSMYWYGICGFKIYWTLNTTAGSTYQPMNTIVAVAGL